MTETLQDPPLVSIVLATYNGEKYVAQQLASLFLQTYTNIEVIAVDDGSTDSTRDILAAHAQQHANMKVVFNEHNIGYIKNFEKGCSLSSGQFIALCDQDDYWHAEKIERMVAAIGDHPMLYCNSNLCDEHLQKTGVCISDRAFYGPVTNCLQQTVFCRIYGHATLITKALYRQAHPFLEVIPHDWWLCYVATLHGGIQYLDEPLVNYRQHAANLFGAVGGKRRKHKSKVSAWQKKQKEIHKIRVRMGAFYRICPDHLPEKKVLHQLTKSYHSFSLPNNFLRSYLFFKYHKALLAVKKRSLWRKYFFCLKMFFIVK